MSASIEHVLEKLGVKARRMGSRWWAERCPMPGHTNQNEAHRFKNFFVRADGHKLAGLWTCYSCKEGGKLFELVMKVRGSEFRDAIEWLKGIEDAPAVVPVVRVRYAPLGARGRAFVLPDGVEFGPLESWNSVARVYLRGRGVDAAQVERWGLGYSLMGRCAGRVVFPIVDSAGRLANYAARTFIGDETRYLAADEREAPDTSVMLGERFWPTPAERARQTVIVFEGALSGMALERALRAAGLQAQLAGLQGSDVANPRRSARLSGFGRVVSAADPDKAGERVSADLAAALRRLPFTRFVYPRAGVDAADTPPEDLAAALRACLSAA